MPVVANGGARKYVQALLELAVERDQIAEVRETLRGLQKTVAEVPELVATLQHPRLPDDQKRELLRRAAGGESTPLAAGFLDLLISDDQLGILPQVADLYEQLYPELRGMQRAAVETLIPLSEQLKERLRAALEKLVGTPVVIEERINPDIIGGLRICLGYVVIDDSVRGRLQRMRDAVGQAPTGI